MRCKNCGGELIFENGLGVCESCGTKYKLEQAFENVDVCICYIENDTQGRRTKDSVIAQDIYNKLENANISAFYERVSLSNVIGETFEQASYLAIYNAKIVLVFGTTREHFTDLLNKYRTFLADKKVLPIYSDMNAYDIPKELNKYQALNYDAVGAATDLIKNVLTLLGRENEVDIVELSNKISKKRRRIILIITSAILAVIIGIGAYIVLGTPYVLTSKKYSYAQDLMEQGEFIKAIDAFSKISGYENSDNLIKNIYDRYDGYYQSDDGIISLHLNIEDITKASIEITKKSEDGKLIKIIETAEVDGTVISFVFTDSQSNEGNAVLTLENDYMRLETNIDKKNDALSIGVLNVPFSLDKKSDKPIIEKINNQHLLKWLSQRTTLTDIKQMGYEVNFEHNIINIGTENYLAHQYVIKNTDIRLLLLDYDLSKKHSGTDMSKTMLKEPVIFAVSAPAELFLPEKVGDDFRPFVKEDILYVPNGEFSQDFCQYYFSEQFDDRSYVYDDFENINFHCAHWEDGIDYGTITDDTVICATSKFLLGSKNFAETVNFQIIEDLPIRLENSYKTKYGIKSDVEICVNIVSDNNSAYLFSVQAVDPENNYGKLAYYKADKTTGNISFKAEITHNNMPDEYKYLWLDELGLSEEFGRDI